MGLGLADWQGDLQVYGWRYTLITLTLTLITLTLTLTLTLILYA